MKDEELAAIRERDGMWVSPINRATSDEHWQTGIDRHALLAEVDRLNRIFALAGDEQLDLAAEVDAAVERADTAERKIADAWDEGFEDATARPHADNPYRAALADDQGGQHG